MIGTVTDEERMIAEVAGEFFADGFKIPADDSASARYDLQGWRNASQLGLPLLGMPAELDGLGVEFGALGQVLRKAGRWLSPLPLLGSVATLQQLLLRAAPTDDGINLLGMLMSGDSIGALALGHRGEVTSTSAQQHQWRLTGTVHAVLDGASANLVFVTACDAEGPALFLVDDEDAGFSAGRVSCVDLTREFTKVTLRDCVARKLQTTELSSHLDVVAQIATVARACEQFGGAQRCLEMSVQHVRDRVQFGRRLGSFQAVKHQLADIAVVLDQAQSAVEHATWVVSHAPEQLPRAAALAGAVCTRVSTAAADAVVHLHGGTGFTWEHPAHLYLRRAISDAAVFGDENHHREMYLAAALADAS